MKYDAINLGYLVLLYLNRSHNYQLVKGGSHMVAQAINKVIHLHHGLVKNNQRIKRIVVEGGEARGVEMIDGTVYQASKAVISTIDPIQTFISLMRAGDVPEAFAKKIKNWKWESYSLFGVHSALEEPPRFKAAEGNADINRACVYILGYEKLEDLITHFDGLDKGEMTEIKGSCWSVYATALSCAKTWPDFIFAPGITACPGGCGIRNTSRWAFAK